VTLFAVLAKVAAVDIILAMAANAVCREFGLFAF
jgi:hypothetical protein